MFNNHLINEMNFFMWDCGLVDTSPTHALLDNWMEYILGRRHRRRYTPIAVNVSLFLLFYKIRKE